MPLDDLTVQHVANLALDCCGADASTWTPHRLTEHVTHITTEAGATVALVADRAQLPLRGSQRGVRYGCADQGPHLRA